MKLLKNIGITILEIIVFCFIVGLISLGLMWLIDLVGLPVWETFSEAEATTIEPYSLGLYQFLPMLIAVIAAIYFHNRLFNRPQRSAGFEPVGVLKEFGLGWLYATIMLGAGFLLLLALGFIQIDNYDFSGKLFFGFVLFFLIQSSFEELLSRSFMIPAIEQRFTPLIGVIVSSLIFSVLHGANPDVSLWSLLSIFLAGLVLGLLFINYRRIWAAIGLHTGWNFMQGSFLGFDVSGFETYSLINTSETGPDLLTGGSFGFEGSVLAVLFLTLFGIYLIKKNPSILDKPSFYSDNENIATEQSV